MPHRPSPPLFLPPMHRLLIPHRRGLSSVMGRRQAVASALPRRGCHHAASAPLHQPEASHPPRMFVYDYPAPLPYAAAWELQHSFADLLRRDESHPDVLLVLQHEPVYTLGTASKVEHVLFDAEMLRRGERSGRRVDAPSDEPDEPLLFRTERGGEVTYHGPGQLVLYPILNLTRHRKDLHWYLRTLEEVVIDALATFGLEAGRKEGMTGVWVGERKVCAMGLKVSKWVTMHGLALNVNVDLKPFERIVPCGIADYDVSSMHLLASDVEMEAVKRQLLRAFVAFFGPYHIEYAPPEAP